MRVAVIEPSGRLYGSEFCLLDIIDGLPHGSYDWQVILPSGAGFDRLLLERGIDCHFLIPRDLGALFFRQKLPIYLRILWRLRTLKPDLLYVNQTGSLRSAAWYARCLGLPVVCQVQTLEDARWLSKHPELHGVVQAFICNSQFIASQTDCDSEKKCVLYQGISSERVEQAAKNRANKGEGPLGSEAFTIGILGRIAKSKGHYLLLDAAKILKDRLANCRFVVIGEGLTPEDTHRFEEKVRCEGLDSLFEFRGYRKNLATELARLDLLVIPSLQEPLGRVLFDAAEFTVPVVLSNAGGLGELSTGFDVGVRFESGDAESMAQSIIDLENNYGDMFRDFKNRSLVMLQSLSMESYLASVEKILSAAARRVKCAEIWLGDHSLAP